MVIKAIRFQKTNGLKRIILIELNFIHEFFLIIFFFETNSHNCRNFAVINFSYYG